MQPRRKAYQQAQTNIKSEQERATNDHASMTEENEH